MKKLFGKIYIAIIGVSLIAISLTANALTGNDTVSKNDTIYPPDYSLGDDTDISYQTNESGQTYGSKEYEYKLGTPDLVAAVGTNGVSGYVYASDLNKESPAAQEETFIVRDAETGIDETITLNISEDIIIPLYSSDGETVLGEFVISGMVMLSSVEDVENYFKILAQDDSFLYSKGIGIEGLETSAKYDEELKNMFSQVNN